MTKDALIVDYSVYAEQDDSDPADHFASGDDIDDRATVADINRRLEDGDIWAWAHVMVVARVAIDGEIFEGRADLYGCNYRDEADFTGALGKPEGYYADMRVAALDDLIRGLKVAVVRGKLADHVGNLLLKGEI